MVVGFLCHSGFSREKEPGNCICVCVCMCVCVYIYIERERERETERERNTHIQNYFKELT